MTAPLRIMYLNPLGTPAHDALFAEGIAKVRLPGTEVHCTSLPAAEGALEHIEYWSYEARATNGIVRAARAAAREGFDAFVIGCFYDTALHNARELSGGMVVMGPCISSCEIAASLSNRFGIIVGREKWVAHMKRNVHEYGYGDRLAGFYSVGLGVTDFHADPAETERRLIAAGRRAVEEDHAECLILGCTMEIGFYKRLEDELGVPVIDPALAAFKRAEYAATLKRDCGWVPSRRWSCEPPPEADLARIGGFDVNEPFGSRLVLAA